MKLLKMNRLLAIAMVATLITGTCSMPVVAAETLETENAGNEMFAEHEAEDEIADEQESSIAVTTETDLVEEYELNDEEDDGKTNAESTAASEVVEEISEDSIESATEETTIEEIVEETETAEESESEAGEPQTETEVGMDDIETADNADSEDAPAEEVVEDEASKENRKDNVSGYWTYEVNSSGAKITKYSGSQSTVTIPDSLGGYAVTIIGSNAFLNNSYIQTVTIPTKIESIEGSAFSGCSRLSKVYFNAKKCTSVGYDTFGGAGANSSSMSVIFGSGVTIIPDYLFYKWNSVAHVTYVSIPSSVTTIGYRAFDGCSDLSSITWGSNIQKIDRYAFQGCSSLTSANLPSSVTEIGYCAFCDCSNITTVTIPAKVSSIGGSAFNGCPRLSHIYFNAKNCTSAGYDVFGGAGSSVSSLSVVFGSGVTKIPSDLFYKWDSLAYVTSVKIPNTVTEIGSYAFNGLENITSIELGSNVKSIGNYAFSNCLSLKKVVIKSINTEFGYSIFDGCNASLCIHCYRGSTAANYAKENGIKVSNLDLPKVAGVKLTNLSSGVKVSWSKTSGANAYSIYRKASNTGWTKIATVKGANTLSFTDKKVANSNGSKYMYNVKAVNGSRISRNATTVSVIRLKGTSFTKAYNVASCKMVLKWSKNAKASGYKIQYATNKSFKGATTITVKGGSKVSKTIAKLRKGKTYYVRIRCCRTSGSSTYYSAWGPVKSVKISK